MICKSPRFNCLSTAIATVLISGCAAVEANRRVPGSVSGGVFTPQRSPATQYGVDPAIACPTGGVMGAVEEEVAASKSNSTAKADGRLCAAAEALLGWDRSESPDEGVLRFVAWYFGWLSPIHQVNITSVETEDTRQIADIVRQAVSKFAAAVPQARFGVATDRSRRGATKVALVMDAAPIEIDSVPRRLQAGAQATLKGTLQGPFSNAKVLISEPGGKFEKPVTSSGKEFRADLRCADRAGLILIEVRGESDEGKGERILANFPVACAANLPTSVALRSTEGAAPVTEEEKKIFEQINAERTAEGLPPLTWDESLARVAREVSQKRGANPESAASVDVSPFLKQADITAPMVLENPGQARSAEEAQARFSASPRHRSNFMTQEATHSGVGIARANDASGNPTVFVSELFLRELPPADTQAIREKLSAAIVQRRVDARAATIKKDTTLDDIAQRYAKELAADQGILPKDKGDELLNPVRKGFLTVNILSGAKSEPLEFAEEPSIVSKAKLFGVGVAQGTHPTLGKNAIYVVVLLGNRR